MTLPGKKKKENRSRHPKAPSNAATNEKQRQQQLDRQEHHQQEKLGILDSLKETGRGKQQKKRVVALPVTGKQYAGASFHGSRSYLSVLTGSEAISPASSTSYVSDHPQKVLESVSNFPKSPEHEPSTMNWSHVVKPKKSPRPGSSRVAEDQHHSYAKGDEYHVLRMTANKHWDSMRSYNREAAVARSKHQWQVADDLSDQAKEQAKLARAADEKASQDIFQARNKCIENEITIDLHGQLVKEAMKILKQHLRLGTIRTLRVITGWGKHGEGNSKLKQSVIKLLKKKVIQWSEENRGTLLIKLDGNRKFSSQDTESDSK